MFKPILATALAALLSVPALGGGHGAATTATRLQSAPRPTVVLPGQTAVRPDPAAMEAREADILQKKEASLNGLIPHSEFEYRPDAGPTREFTPITPVAKPAPAGLKAPARLTSKPAKAFVMPDSLCMIAKDMNIENSLYISPITLRKGTDGKITIENIYGMGSITGYKAPEILIDAATGKVSIPSQVVVPNYSNYGDVSVAKLIIQGGQLYYSNDPIEGTIDDEGNITLGSWGVIVTAGSQQGAVFNAFNQGLWVKCNATYTHTMSTGKIRTGQTLIEQVSPSEIAFYNMGGNNWGEVLYANIYSDKTARITPQLVFNNLLLGSFYAYKIVVGSDGKLSIDTKGSIVVTTTETGYSVAPWIIASRTAPGSYQAATYTDTKIETTFKPTWPTALQPSFEGQGTQTSPYKLKNANDLAALSQVVMRGEGSYASAYYEIANDIDFGGLTEPFYPIGDDDNMFAGHLDGKNFTIKNFTLNGRGAINVGLFGVTATGATIKNLKLDKPNISGSGMYVSTLVGLNNATLDNIHVTNAVVKSQGEMAGGIAAQTNAPILNSSAQGTLSSYGSVGGIAADAFATIKGCHTDVNISLNGYINGLYHMAGGITGAIMNSAKIGLQANIEDCYVMGTITDNIGQGMMGGITGQTANGTWVMRCFNTATVSGKRLASSEYDNYTAGIVGWAREGGIRDCYNAGTIMKSGTSEFVGGIVGYIAVGYQSTSGQSLTIVYTSDISNCYNSAQVTSTSTNVDKSVVGSSYYYPNSSIDPIAECISNCYSDNQIMGMRSELFGKTTAELTSGTLPAGFSSDVWQAKAGEYPTLKTFGDNVAVRLSAATLKFADGEDASKMKKSATINGNGVTWKIFDSANSAFVDENLSLRISGNTLNVKNNYATDVVVVMDDDQHMKMYRVAVVPKAFQGEGTAASPYLINNKEDLKTLNTAVAGFGQAHVGDYFRLTADIDLQKASDFEGIGARVTPAYSFGGVFDGDGHTINNLKIAAVVYDANGKADGSATGGSYAYAGLFNGLAETGVIKNLNIGSGCEFDFFGYSGALVGWNMGRVENCRNYAHVRGVHSYIGGLAGYGAKTSVISNCYNDGLVETGSNYAGGIEGAGEGLIEYCQNAGEVTGHYLNDLVTSNSQNSIGGIIGGMASTSSIDGCSNLGNISGWRNVGGLAGYAIGGSIANSVSNGMLRTFEEVPTRGAIIGSTSSNSPKMQNAYYDGAVILCNAVASSGAVGCTSLSTNAFVEGKALTGLNADKWVFAANSYPVLKAFANEPAVKAMASIFLNFQTNETANNIQKAVTLSPSSTINWSLTDKSGEDVKVYFTLADGKVNVVVPTGMEVGRDTLTAKIGDVYVKEFALQTVPVIFEGQGTEASPYQIKTVADMHKLAGFIFNTGYDYANTHFRLMNDIDWAGDTIKPIAVGGKVQFAGVFDGNGKTLKGFEYENIITINTAAKPHPLGYIGRYISVFGKVSSTGVIKNLTVDGHMKVERGLGGIVSDMYGRMENCVSRSNLEATYATYSYTGGLVCRLYPGGVIKDSRFDGTVSSTKNCWIGGIAYMADDNSLIENCTYAGHISGALYIGGIAAQSNGTIRGCTTLKEASVKGTNYIGGMVYRLGADNKGFDILVENCTNNMALVDSTASFSKYGGIAAVSGKNNNTVIRNCHNHGKILAKGEVAGIINHPAPGLVLTDCSNDAPITATGASDCGGIIAESDAATEAYPITISNVFNTGAISGCNSYCGGVIGALNTGCTLTNAYNTGDIECKSAGSSHYAFGGVCGSLRGTATACYNLGNLNGVGQGMGGVSGIMQGGTMEQCFNLGNIFTTGQYPTSYRMGQAGGLVGYSVTAATIRDSYSMGNITAQENAGGLVGRFANTDALMHNVYFGGALTLTTDKEDPVSGYIYVYSSKAPDTKNIYYDNTINTRDIGNYTSKSNGRSTDQLCTVELSDNFVYNRATLPLLKVFATNPQAALAAIHVMFTKSGDTPGNINEIFYIGHPMDDMIWTCSEHFQLSKSDPGKVYPVKIGKGWVKIATPDGKYSRTIELTVNTPTGVETNGMDANPVLSITYYDLQGNILTNPAKGSIVIVRTVYTDGTATTAKQVIR